ncbi:MAG: hypothetical protein Greene041662_360 [Candidatus Peregrinibacteria bacterium Greene0416_62]|nr:MAG: hypothetical protein Greene041662_360 [Candidatus Peregrinibacteria bacterium Greene0416_62]
MNEDFKVSAPEPSEKKSEQKNAKEQADKDAGGKGGASAPSREELKVKLDTLYKTLDTAREESKEKTTPKARETEQVIRDIDIRFNEFVDNYRVKNKIIPEFDEKQATDFNEKLDRFIEQISSAPINNDTAPAAMEKEKKSPEKENTKPKEEMKKSVEPAASQKNTPEKTKSAQERFVSDLYDQTVVDIGNKIQLMQKQQQMSKQELKESSFGKSAVNVFTVGGLVGTSLNESSQNSLDLATAALEGKTEKNGNTTKGLLQERSLLLGSKDLPAEKLLPQLLTLRARIGIIDVTYDLNEKYGRNNKDYSQRQKDARNNKDSDLTVDYIKINEALAATEGIIDAWETGIEIGSAVALGIATGGAGPAVRIGAELARSIATEIQKVSAKQKSFEQAAQDAVISALSNALGAGIAKNLGKALKSGAKVAKFDTLIAKAAKLIEQTVKDPKKLAAVQKIGNAGVNVVKNAANNALEGATDGLVGGTAHSIVDDVKEKGTSALVDTETYKKAGNKAYENAKAGAVGGAVLGTATNYAVKGVEKGVDIVKNGKRTNPVDLKASSKNAPDITTPNAALDKKNTNPKTQGNETPKATKEQTKEKASPAAVQSAPSQNPPLKAVENPNGRIRTKATPSVETLKQRSTKQSSQNASRNMNKPKKHSRKA